MPDPELEGLIEEYHRADAEWQEFDERIRSETDPQVRSDLEVQRNLRDQQRRGLRMEIESRGGSVGEPEPAPPTPDPPATEPATVDPTPPAVHLHAPPESIDDEWNQLVHDYEDALDEAAAHATMTKDDWSCGDGCDGASHDGCSIWWRGHLQELLAVVRYRALLLLDDLAGPRTQEEIASSRTSDRLRSQIADKDRELASAEKEYDDLVARFEEEEKTHEALRQAGGQVAPYTGVLSAGRERLLADIEKARQEKNRIFEERHDLLAKLLATSGAALEVRAARGLERSEGRYGWDDTDLDIGKLSDDDLLKALLGPVQYGAMRAEMDKQGAHQRKAQQTEKEKDTETSMAAPSAGVPGWLMGVAAVVVLLIVALGAIFVFGNGGGDDEVAASDTGQESDAVGSDAGDSDTGDSDTGDSDTGDSDTGDSDTGDSNAGDDASGEASSGGDDAEGSGTDEPPPAEEEPLDSTLATMMFGAYGGTLEFESTTDDTRYLAEFLLSFLGADEAAAVLPAEAQNIDDYFAGFRPGIERQLAVILSQQQDSGIAQNTYGVVNDPGDGTLEIMTTSIVPEYVEGYWFTLTPCDGFPSDCREITLDGLTFGGAPGLDVVLGFEELDTLAAGGADATQDYTWLFSSYGKLSLELGAGG